MNRMKLIINWLQQLSIDLGLTIFYEKHFIHLIARITLAIYCGVFPVRMKLSVIILTATHAAQSSLIVNFIDAKLIIPKSLLGLFLLTPSTCDLVHSSYNQEYYCHNSKGILSDLLCSLERKQTKCFSHLCLVAPNIPTCEWMEKIEKKGDDASSELFREMNETSAYIPDNQTHFSICLCVTKCRTTNMLFPIYSDGSFIVENESTTNKTKKRFPITLEEKSKKNYLSDIYNCYEVFSSVF